MIGAILALLFTFAIPIAGLSPDLPLPFEKNGRHGCPPSLVVDAVPGGLIPMTGSAPGFAALESSGPDFLRRSAVANVDLPCYV
jgi:hypothetical protein